MGILKTKKCIIVQPRPGLGYEEGLHPPVALCLPGVNYIIPLRGKRKINSIKLTMGTWKTK